MNRHFVFGGVIAGAVLIIAGIGTIAIGAVGRSDVTDKLKQGNITGSPDMTPEAVAKETRAAGLTDVELPTCSVAGEDIDSGGKAKCFAEYMRIDALEATGGETHAEMPRFATADGKGHERRGGGREAPGRLPRGQPGPQRLGDRDRARYRPQHVVLRPAGCAVHIVMGVALLLTGIGFPVLTVGVLRRESQRGSQVGSPAAATP